MLLFSRLGWSQGATTAAMSGVITDKNGAGLPGATVIAVHTPTNTQYVTPTNAEGRFNIQNMRVGPYSVKVTFVGYKDVTRDDVNLTLGQNLRFDQKLTDANTELNEVTVSGRRDPIMNADHTGASTTIQRETIERLPTLNRSFDDFTRLTPQASASGGFAGRNGGFNNVTIDGAIFNNSFGLSSTVGGQANAQPISLDAIEQIQVSIAPYDVRQGSFTGAGINAVTRSGSNKFTGSLYGFYRNQDFVGSKVADIKSDYPTFNLKNYGFRVGGPIIKDKLFFFLNAEEERRVDPPTGNFTANRSTTAPAANSTVSRASYTDLTNLGNFLQSKYGYNAGPFENFELRSFSRKATAKLDWNINANHRLSVKYNYLKSYRDVPPSSSGSISNSANRNQTQFGLPFFSSYYTINNNLNSVIAELNSTFGTRFSNNLTAGLSAFRDFRESPGGGNFPLVDIGDATGRSAANAGPTAANTLTSFGYEPFSAFNILNSDVYQIGDNLTAYLGKHNVTVGTYNELYKFSNGFAPNYYGGYAFNSLDDFYASARTTEAPNGYVLDANRNPVPASATNQPGLPNRYQLQYSALPGGFPFGVTKAAQFGLYAQDEWSPRNNLKVTIGLRGDVPVIFSDIERNIYVGGGTINGTTYPGLTFRDGVRIETDRLPKSRLLMSPRIGVNWDVNDDRKTQVRGGTGIFTGRVPFVWISNQASNNGVQFGSFSRSGAAAAVNPFSPDVDKYRPDPNGPVPLANTSYNLAVTDPNFKFPQVWRTNVAVDQEIAGGVIATLEALYTKDVNAVYHQNVNLPNPTRNAAGPDMRPIYYSIGAAGSNGLAATTANNRIYGGQGGASTTNPNISDAILMTNTSKGYSYSITGQLQKSFSGGLYLNAAYTYSDSRSVNDGGSIAQSIWRDRSVSGETNANVLSYSQFLIQHRVIASASYKREYLGHLGTTLSLFYEASPAGRFSYLYGGDMNGDSQSNDLIYVPRNQSEIILRDIAIPATQGGGTYTAAQQWADLDKYISQDSYLKNRRGDYAERNGAVRPWQNRLDFRLLQDIFTNVGENRNSLQLSLDIFNIGNLLNSNWGTFQTANRTGLLSFAGYTAQGQPAFTYPYLTNPSIVTPASGTTPAVVAPGVPLTETFRKDTGGLGSRWQAQVGVRYIFN
ncbi:TonB-dependent receptor [Hymenobacter sp. BT770]|uniref:TonB-dependent receptor n=1 Tax=Hymenobacter sp. BT770 TaxID=2886942 RepID=UPI001D109D6C|nr:TonB-dependent receptor [Hymenobacter sp. BT770]MCC3153827.1 TonB-dependent receptor [Hymenobacter sp. BT770]MDO3415971.1 TonB-dependent receptor [Hymenobacter sp. BT770]